MALFVAAGPAIAAVADDWPAGDKADIEKVQAFLNGLTTYRARFIQVSSDGAYAEGMFWLSRPGLARFEYAPPNNLLLVADGTFLIFFDRDIDQVTHVSYDAGPFRFLLADHVDLSKGMKVNALERRGGMLRITLADEDDLDEGTVTLVFQEQPMRLAQWEVVDSEGKLTRVTLYDQTRDLSLERKLFRFTGNDRANPDYRYGTYNK